MKIKNLAFIAPFALLPLSAMAFDLPSAPNAAIQSALDVITTGSYGAAILQIIDVIGKAAVILTAAAFSIQTFCTTVGAALNKVGLTSFADRVKKVCDVVKPWIAYMSLYNVQHGQLVNPVKALRKA